MNEYTPEDVVIELKALMGEEEDQGVARELGTGKQNLNQFKKGKQQDVKMKIIGYLLRKLKKRSRK